MLDRIDIHVEVPAVEYEELSSYSGAESSAKIKERVDKARKIQNERFADTGVTCNARITADLLRKVCATDDKAEQVLRNAFDKLGLSARAYDRVLKVSRTIADLDASEIIRADHVLEAVQYRTLDKKYWSTF